MATNIQKVSSKAVRYIFKNENQKFSTGTIEHQIVKNKVSVSKRENKELLIHEVEERLGHVSNDDMAGGHIVYSS